MMLQHYSSQPMQAPRVALVVEYNGSGFHGWQRQEDPAVATVQRSLEAALSQVADAPVTLVCAGRTDRGVHASNQVVHFDPPRDRSAKAWVCGANALLPASVVVKNALPVDAEFHARFSAIARTYRYFIYNSAHRPGIFAGQLSWVKLALDEGAMHEAGQYLLGELDFSAFRAAGCQSKSAFRYVEYLRVSRSAELVCVEIKANAFLLHMVRNIVGSLLEVGMGHRKPGWIAELQQCGDRREAAATAPADGLYLVGVDYPPVYALPAGPRGPDFLLPL